MARFIYGLVLFGLGLIQDDSRVAAKHSDGANGNDTTEGNSVENLEERVEKATRAVAPVLLPMIDALGGLEIEETVAGAGAGEES